MSSSFKVLIIGGGPVGLLAAHALSKAGIDFLVLEARPQIAEDVGASLVFLPYSMRVLAQLGLMDGLRERGHEVLRWADYTQKGLRGDYPAGEMLMQNHGSASFATHRADIVKYFYDSLSEADKSRVLLDKKLSAIEKTANGGVVVTCVDGSTGEKHSFQGSIVLGADGVHSKTRTLMQELEKPPKKEAEATAAAAAAAAPFKAEYKTMWCCLPRRWEFAPGEHCITHSEGASLQFIVASQRCWVFAYEKLAASSSSSSSSTEKTTTTRKRFTPQEMEAFAQKHGHLSIGGRLTLADVVPHRFSGGMSLLEEGIATRWYQGGRVVLAGDAAHKFTPNAGLGLNNGLQDVVVLVNALRKLLLSSSSSSTTKQNPPDDAALEELFRRYQETRAERVAKDLKFSAATTRMCAWPTWGWWAWDWVLGAIPGFQTFALNFWGAKDLSDAFCLDYLEGDEPFVGRVPWKYPIPKPKMA